MVTSRSAIQTKLALLITIGVLASCATAPAGPPPTLSIGAILRHVEPVGETSPTQTRGGLTLTLAPVSFDTVTTTACSYRPVELGLLQRVPEGVSERTHTLLEENRFGALRVRPTELTLLLTIRNQMDRVFRGAGAVVQFTVDQSVQAVEQSKYLEFLNTPITPGSETQIRMRGPSLPALRDGATFGVLLFDVVTAIDNAGNISNRDNFEWYFEVRHEVIRRTLETVEGRRRVWVLNGEARSVMASSGIPSSLPARVVRPDGTIVRSSTVTTCLSR